MSNEIKKINDEVRMKQWMAIINECRSSGIPAKEWLKLNNINQASYYRWLKRIRETIIESSESHSNEIVEIRSNSLPAPSINPVIAVVVSKGDSRIEISSDCPEWMIKTILGNLC